MSPSERYLQELKRGLPLRGRRRVLSEYRHHLEAAIAEGEAGGLDHADAERIAIERLGPPGALAERFADDDGAGNGRSRRGLRIAVIAGVCVGLVGAALFAFSATRLQPVDARSSHPVAAPPPVGHGPSIVSVRALPAAVQQHGVASLLSVRRLNTVTASTALGFKVSIRNRGGQPATVTVTLTIDRRSSWGGPIVTQRTLGVIRPSETKSLTFDHLGPVPFAALTSLEVTLPSGDAKVYPVIFSLPSGNGTFAPVAGLPRPRIQGTIAVPRVVGLAERAALARLQSLGLEVLVVTAPSGLAAGRVVAQSPSAAGMVGRRGLVKVVVSTGPASRK